MEDKKIIFIDRDGVINHKAPKGEYITNWDDFKIINNNKNFNDEALRINRELKKENDAMSLIIDEVEDFLLNVNTQWEDDKQSERLQQMIINVRSRDGK